ncbi:MAG: cytochrome C [Geobacter sp.]|nr:MAG: cytochrome C [Geobacter sp.]
MKSLILAATLIVFGASAALAADCLVFPASMGKVSFPHQKHIDKLKDCTLCHATKAGGKIAGFDKAKAHKLCIDCHKKMKSGPTGCKDCHKK